MTNYVSVAIVAEAAAAAGPSNGKRSLFDWLLAEAVVSTLQGRPWRTFLSFSVFLLFLGAKTVDLRRSSWWQHSLTKIPKKCILSRKSEFMTVKTYSKVVRQSSSYPGENYVIHCNSDPEKLLILLLHCFSKRKNT